MSQKEIRVEVDLKTDNGAAADLDEQNFSATMKSVSYKQIVSTAVMQGRQGEPGEGIATGGSTGQILAKASSANYDTTWIDPADGSVDSVNGRTGSVTGLAEQSDLTAHISSTSNPHGVTKAQVGLGSADNTSDADKPISTATSTALATKRDKIVGQVNRAYTTDTSGNDSAVQYASGTTVSTLMYRDTSGRSSVNAGTTSSHIVNKGQMDTADAALQTQINDLNDLAVALAVAL